MITGQAQVWITVYSATVQALTTGMIEHMVDWDAVRERACREADYAVLELKGRVW